MKARLPLSLLFAVASVSAFAADSFSTSATLAPTRPTAVFKDPLLSKQWQWYPSKNGVSIAPVWADGVTGAGKTAAWQAFAKLNKLNDTTVAVPANGSVALSSVVIGVIDDWVEPNHEDLKVSLYWREMPKDPAALAEISQYYGENGLSRDFVGMDRLVVDNPETEDVDESQEQIYTNESHGTFVSGMAAAVGGNDVGIVGAAPGATIAGLHVNINSNNIVEAALWKSGVSKTESGLAYSGESAIQVRNCSFGGFFLENSQLSKAFLDAVDASAKNNVVYVFAAGNSRSEDDDPGTTGWSGFGNSRSIINVAATSKSGKYSDFSSFGSNIFVAAPGADVVSTDRTGELGYNQGNVTAPEDSFLPEDPEAEQATTISDANYAASDGTSFSSPLVAGVIALGKEVCPVMDVRWAKHALAYSSGHGDAPNIDAVWDEEKQTYVQDSDYAIISDEGSSKSSVEISDTGNRPAVNADPAPEKTGISTGDWQKNQGGYWFNNNYGFGLVNPEGFVDTVRDIAYTTVETQAKGTVVAGDAKASDDRYSAKYSVGVTRTDNESKPVSLLTQKVETVAVTVNLSMDALTSANFNIGSLKVVLTDPNGVSSVLVQNCTADPGRFTIGAETAEALGLTSYTFLTNAFWGSSYGTNLEDWTISLEYDILGNEIGIVPDTSNWVTVSGVDFTMGEFVGEGSGGVAVGNTVNAHALVLDGSSFNVAGEFFVEDAVYVNGGSFAIAAGGQVGAYEDADLKKGAIYVQTGGSASVSGAGAFVRGIHLYGGSLALSGVGSLVGEIHVDGGAFSVTKTGDDMPTFGNVTLRGGRVSVGSGMTFSSNITVYGGTLDVAANVGGADLNVYGGTATLAGAAKFGAISVGRISVGTGEGGADEYYGGDLVVNGQLTAGNGIEFSGLGTGLVKTGAKLVADSVEVGGAAKLQLSERSAIDGSLNVSGQGRVDWTGNVGVSGDISVVSGTLAATGDTVLRFAGGKAANKEFGQDGNGVNAPQLNIGSKGTFVAGKTKLYGVDMTLNAGATLAFASRTRDDYDLLTLGSDKSVNNAKASSLSLTDTYQSGDSIVVQYNFGDAIPYTASLIKLEDGAVFDGAGIDFDVVVDGAPQLYVADASGKFVLRDLSFDVGENEAGDLLSLVPEAGAVVENHRLYYAGQTSQQSAIQMSLLKNEATAAPFLSAVDEMERVSELLGAYDDLGAPANVIAIDELHDKQANAITGAVSRRSRELRSGFIHADVFSNPLLGNSGFTFSARPNQVAGKGFIPYMSVEDDYPIMFWMNGGYSFSEADEASMGVSATESSMTNVALGVDYEVASDLAIGIFAGYTNGRSKFDGGDRTEIQSRNIGVYLAGANTDEIGTLYYTAVAAFGYEEYDFKRKLAAGALSASAEASPEGWQGIAFLEGGYEWKMDKFSMGPVVSLRYVANNIDGYTESSADAWMCQEVDDVNYDSLQSSVGWRFAYRADFETVTLLPELRVSWNHEFLGTDEDFDARLAMPGSDSYTCTIMNTGDDYATVGAGLSVMLGDVSTISFDYDMQFLRDDADPTHSFNVMYRARF